jgi:Sulfotransferase family
MGRDGSPLRDRVIFVEGAPRSGTTWLVNLLATHPEIAGVEAESHLFDFGVNSLFDNHEGRSPVFGLNSFLDHEELVDLVRDFCDGVFAAMRSHVSNGSTPPFVVEKTPMVGGTDPLDLERKRDVYPDAWYIHIVRDREAVARSLMRAPWMPNRSFEACAGLWDRTVGRARATLGELPRYREVSYDELRSDPAQCCRELFDWLGIESSDDVLETVRVLSREKFSDIGAVTGADNSQTRVRRVLSTARALVDRQLAPDEATQEAAGELTFRFARAMRERDAETLRLLTKDSLEVVYRSSERDLSLHGEEARAELARIADQAFARRYVGEWWASSGYGHGEWWTRNAGKPLTTVFCSALGGDATRVDFAIALLIEDDLISRAVVISAGPLAGRAVVPHSDSADPALVAYGAD